MKMLASFSPKGNVCDVCVHMCTVHHKHKLAAYHSNRTEQNRIYSIKKEQELFRKLFHSIAEPELTYYSQLRGVPVQECLAGSYVNRSIQFSFCIEFFLLHFSCSSAVYVSGSSFPYISTETAEISNEIIRLPYSHIK